jgi:NADH dehydrogenase
VVTGSIQDAAAVQRAVQGVDVVVCAVTGFPSASPARVDVDGTRQLAEAAERAGAEFVMVSVAGASAESPMALFRAKYAAEQALRGSKAPFTIIRPDAFADLWLDLLTKSAGRAQRPLVFGHGDNPIGWVAVQDVTALTVHVVQSPSLRGATLTICGPARLTLTELADVVRQAHGWTSAPRHVPRTALRVAAILPGQVGRQAAAALAMDEIPAVSDDVSDAMPDLPRASVEELLARRPAARV